MTRILLVEDDNDLSRGLRFNLESEGFDVVAVDGGHAALATVRGDPPDLVLLDLGLPDLDGTEVLKTLRSESHEVPVICLTARGAESDVVMGLDLGADDYITKPFGLSELLARIGAVLRRGGATLPTDTEPAHLTLDDVEVDFRAHTATWPDRTLELTPIEIDLLRHLLASRGEAIDRTDILRDLWGLDGPVSTRTLDNHIARLRKKIEPDPAAPRWLVTVHGVGYRLER
ncbi:MAG: DNA-binding response regulator [Planctomycetes bacterium]|nr:DNA-binding response regulator [Planctomycetota bacterium]